MAEPTVRSGAWSTLTCPDCGHRSRERMPTDACQWFFDCPACRRVLRPLPGDCCVFCSYGDVPCPPVQEARATGGVSARGAAGRFRDDV